MGSPDDIGARLRVAGTRWVTARGVVRHHRRHDLVSIGFERHFEALTSSGTGWAIGAVPDAAVAAAVGDRTVIEAVSGFAVDRDGHRRVEVVSRQGDEWLADLVVVDGDTWWARTGDGVMTNHGDVRFQHGGTEELRLLTPDRVPDGYILAPTTDIDVVAGRSCAVVVAAPRPPRVGRPRPGSEQFAMITGGDRFRLSVDDRTGVVLRVVKEVDGTEAETVEFTEIVFDELLSPELFVGLS